VETELQGKGALVVRAYKGTPFYEAKWRDAAASSSSAGSGERGWNRTPREAGGNDAAGSATGSSTRGAPTER
jgi:hypothetical protein